MVDWPSELWDVSFKGVPFYVERDTQSAGRRVAVHEFWRRDDPFLEDGGASPVRYELSAYVANDALAASVAAVMAALLSEGPGLLVLPLAGPVLVRCIEARRETERDRMGFAAISATFVQEGAGTGLVSLGLLANAIFTAGDAVAAAAGALMASLPLIGYVNRVAEETQSAFEDAIAGLEVLRTSMPLAPDVSATVRDDLANLFADVPTLITSAGADATAGIRLVTAARDLCEGMSPAAAMASFGAQVDAGAAFTTVVMPTPTNVAIAANVRIVQRLARVANLVAYADTMARVAFTSRRDGINARSAAAERFGFVLNEAGEARDEALVLAVQDLGGQVANYLSQKITTLAPVITVSAPANMPALWWSWRLYADPLRTKELVDRNRVRHPAFMPRSFEALSP